MITKNGSVMDESGWNALEYDKGEPVAIIEYKAFGASVNLGDANNRALARLADRASLPFFLVIYLKHKSLYGVIPVNAIALQMTPERMVLRESEYSTWLHKIRGYATL